jgi:hypothetical protein
MSSPRDLGDQLLARRDIQIGGDRGHRFRRLPRDCLIAQNERAVASMAPIEVERMRHNGDSMLEVDVEHGHEGRGRIGQIAPRADDFGSLQLGKTQSAASSE